MRINNVRIPKIIDEKIAYIIGFLCGDGHICIRPEKHEYSIYFTGNLKDEYNFYLNFLKPLIANTFMIQPKVKIQKSNATINLIIYSKKLVEFVVEKFDIPVGKKSDKIEIPKAILNKRKLIISFIRGFADADFSLYLKKRYKKFPYYPVISGVSKSKKFILQVSMFLKNLNINHYLYLSEDSSKPNRIEINGIKAVTKWMKIIGFRNYKYLTVYRNLLRMKKG